MVPRLRPFEPADLEARYAISYPVVVVLMVLVAVLLHRYFRRSGWL